MQLIDPREKFLSVVVVLLSALLWSALAYFGFFPSMSGSIIIGHVAFLAYLKNNSVQVSKDQLVNIHAILSDCCKKLGIKTVPECYVIDNDWIFNTMAPYFSLIVLNRAIIDALQDNEDALAFYIGHKLGHAQCRHALKNLFTVPTSLLPLLKPAYLRACEYSADRYGFACCKEKESAIIALTKLAGGDSSIQKTAELVSGFSETLHEILQTHPALYKRIAALDFARGGQRVQFPRYNPFAYGISLLVPSLTNRFFANAFLTLYFIVLIVGVVLARKIFA